MLRLKLLYIIGSKMLLFSLLPKTIFLHNVNINLIQFSLLCFIPSNGYPNRESEREEGKREGGDERERTGISYKEDREHWKFFKKKISVLLHNILRGLYYSSQQSSQISGLFLLVLNCVHTPPLPLPGPIGLFQENRDFKVKCICLNEEVENDRARNRLQMPFTILKHTGINSKIKSRNDCLEAQPRGLQRSQRRGTTGGVWQTQREQPEGMA